jgi:hypothetical protein
MTWGDVCFLCEAEPISWPGTGMCDACFQATADAEHEAWANDPVHQRMAREGIDFCTAVEREAKARKLI